jgi:hypothetical protein
MSMEQLAKSLYSATSSAVDQFIDRLVAEFQIEKSKAVSIWNSAATDLKILESPPKTTKKAAAKKTPAKATKQDDSDSKKCQYVFSKGNKEGETCGSKVSEDSATGSFCKRHLDKEKTGDKKDVKKPAASKKGAASTSAKKKTEQKESESAAVNSLKDTAPGFKVSINKWRNYEVGGTGLVMDRPSEQVVGRQNSDGSVATLTVDDIEICKNYGLNYKLPPNMSSTEDKDEDEDDEEEPEEDEDDSEDEDE